MTSWISSLIFGEDTSIETEPEVQIFAMFAHKGGVAKTTNLFHMAFQMAQSGEKVIMVDADPQCTLSETCCSLANEDRNWRDGEERGDLNTAWEGAYNDILDGKAVSAASLAVPDRADLCSENGGSLHLLPGTLEIHSLERRLAYAQDLTQRSWLQDVPGWNVLKEGVGVTRQLLLATAKAYDTDVILIDMGPSICDLNFNILFSSDFFIVPANPDRYSKSSLRTLARVLQHWAKNHKELVTLNDGIKCNMKREPPKFAGVIFSRVPYSSHNKPINVNAKWVEDCCAEVQHTLIPSLRMHNMVASNLSSMENDGFMLELIPMFSKVHEIAMRCHAPVFGMEPSLVKDIDKDGEEKLLSGKALETVLVKGNSYQQYFKRLNQRLFEVIADKPE